MPPSQRPILLVDDFDDALEMYAEYLQFHGFHVVVASNGQEAIDRARAVHPALILMDLEMPNVNGVDALRILRTDASFSETPIVALTAHALEAERKEALRNGFDAFIAKPCLPDELKAIIDRLLATRRQT